MKKYKLLAADMDGTALNGKKELSARTVRAMEAALCAGAQVVFATGRGISFVTPYTDMVRGMRYAVTASGAEVTDLRDGTRILHECIDPETVKRILAAAAGSYCLPVIYMDGESYGTRWSALRADDFGLGAFEPIYRSRMIMCEDAFAYFMENPEPVDKLNFFFADDVTAAEILPKIEQLPICFTTLGTRSMEINASGVSKAKGLRALCRRLGIDMAEVIAVGDAQNDLDMLRAAGLGVAMGNAEDEVKRVCSVVTSDCENDGVARLIEEYLLD